MKTFILFQKHFLKQILLLVAFLAYGVSAFAYIVAWHDDVVTVNGVNYHLYYITKTKPIFGGTTTEFSAYVEGITGSGEIVIPETIQDGPSTYTVKGLRYNPITEEVTPTISCSATTIRFKGAIELNPREDSPTFNCPSLQNIYFEGRSPSLYGSYGNYFQSPEVDRITVYLSDRTEEEIERMTTSSTVWGDFLNVAPISNSNVKRNVSLAINQAKVEIGSDTYVRDASTQVDMYSDLTLKVYQGYDVYHVESVKLNGMEILGNMTFTQGAADYLSYYTYTLQNVLSDTYITIDGESTKYEVGVICNRGGTLTSPNANTSTIYPNEQAYVRWFKTDGNSSLKIIPNEGCTFDRLYNNSNDKTSDVTANGDGTYTYTLTGDAFVSVVFKNNSIIQFADPNVKAICVAKWDTNGDGELSKQEAAAVGTLIDETTNKSVFYGKGATITSFDEFQYFTGLEAVETEAFYDDSLQSIILPATIKEIQDRAFSLNKSLKSIILPEGLTTIGVYAFSNSFSLEYITLPESLKKIDAYAFNYSSLKQIFIPKNVNNLGGSSSQNPFIYCKSLVSIEVDEANETFDTNGHCNAIFEHYSSIALLRVGCKATVLPENNSQRLYISQDSYSGIGVTEFVFPANLGKIYDGAFYYNNLEKIVMKKKEPIDFSYRYFSGTATDPRMLNCVVEVPYGTKTAYVQAGWIGEGDEGTQVVKRVIEAAPEPVSYDVNSDGKVTIADVTKLVNVLLGRE
ncbi:MAG: leucine-rich repeat protein [Bacteroidaceae bacterium]|nr:leucine-rich repeat protein [Bacteroidaceae bacterium]